MSASTALTPSAAFSLPPSAAPSFTPAATPDAAQSQPASKRTRGKNKQPPPPNTNGEVNGDPHPAATSESKRTRKSRKRPAEEAVAPPPPPPVPMKEPAPTHSHRTRRRSSRTSQKSAEVAEFVDTPPPHTNGHSATTNGRSSSHRSRASEESASWRNMGPPAVPAEYDEATAATHESSEVWPAAPHFTGPASGYLEDSRMLFSGRNGMAANPGRTIYNARQPNR